MALNSRLTLLSSLILFTACGVTGGFAPKGSSTQSATNGSTNTNSPACNPCKIFVTDQRLQGDFGSPAVADQVCATDPLHPGAGTYKALIVSSSGDRTACTSLRCGTSGAAEHVDWVLKPSTAYVRADGTPIASTNAEGLFIFPVLNSLGVQDTAWTGLNSSIKWTTGVGEDCGGWSLAGASDPATVSRLDQAAFYGEVVGTVATCDQYRSFICVEQ